jgi:hypothetical protein
VTGAFLDAAVAAGTRRVVLLSASAEFLIEHQRTRPGDQHRAACG